MKNTIVTRFPRHMIRLCGVLSLGLIAGCAAPAGYDAPWESPSISARPAEAAPDNIATPQNETAPQAAAPTRATIPTVKVALLLPLTGQHEALGQAMLNAAQLALFDIGFDTMTLLPRDTQGTAAGAKAAAQDAIANGATLVLGPLFSGSVKAVKPIAAAAGVETIAFSTDWTLADSNTYLIGFLPFDQVTRVTAYAAQNGLNDIAVLSPQDSYGNGVVSAYNAVAPQYNINTTKVQRFNAQTTDMDTLMRNFADYDARSNGQRQPAFSAVLLPVGGAKAREMGAYLNQYGLPPQSVRRLGTGLMDDPSLASDAILNGLWFAAPAPQARRNFEKRYRGAYFQKPPRIASLAYDATALASILAQQGYNESGAVTYNDAAITNPNGFAGIDGIFRFREDGIVERGLAVMEYRNGRIVVIDPAPKNFKKSLL